MLLWGAPFAHWAWQRLLDYNFSQLLRIRYSQFGARRTHPSRALVGCVLELREAAAK